MPLRAFLFLGVCVGVSAVALAEGELRLARLEPEVAADIPAPREKVIYPDESRDLPLLAAHHAYTVWSQQFMGATLSDDQTSAWKEFLGMDVRLGDAYRQLGAAAFKDGKLQEAVKLLSTAADFLEPDADLLGQLGFAQKTMGQYERGAKALQQAVDKDSARAEFWLWLGDAQRLLGDYDASVKSFETCKGLAPKEGVATVDEYLEYSQSLAKLEPNWDDLETHFDFAKRHELQGRVLRVIAEYQAGLQVAPPVKDDETDKLFRTGWAQLQMGTQWAYYKQPKLAVDYYLQGLDTYTRGKSESDIMRVHQNLALNYEQMAERYPLERESTLEKAAEEWQSAADLASQLGDTEYLRHVQGGLLYALVATRPVDDPRIVELRTVLEKEVPRRPPVNDYSVASAVRGEAAARLKEGDLAGARALLEMSESYYKETGFLMDLETRARLLAQLAGVYVQQGHGEKAQETGVQALQQIQDLRKYLDADGFLRSANPATERRVAAARALAALQLKKPEDAMFALEQYQAVFAEEALGSRVKDEEWRTDFRTEDQLLLEREGWLKKKLDESTAANDMAQAEWYQDRIDEIADRVKRLPLAQQLAPGAKPSYRGVEVLPAAETQAAMPENTAVLYLHTGEFSGVAVVLTREGAQGYPLEGATDAAMEKAAAGLRAALDAGKADDARSALVTLNDALLAPLKGKLPESGTLAIAADQVLYGLPWRAMDTGGAIAAGVEVCTVPGATTLQRIADSRRGKTVTALEPASGVLPDALAVATAGGGMLLEASVDRKTEDPTLPLWTTGGADPGAAGVLSAALLPLQSMPHGLLALNLDLTPAPAPTAALQFLAISEIAWRAGTGAIVANCWPVDAAVRKEFFDALSAALPGATPAAAFQTAQQQLRNAHPESLDWAAFQYFGAP